MRASSLLALLAVALGLAAAAPAASADPVLPPEEGCDPLIPGICVRPVSPVLCAVEGNPLCE
jgi:hypothetical protein